MDATTIITAITALVSAAVAAHRSDCGLQMPSGI